MKRYCLAAVITASLGVSYSAQAYNCAGVPVWDSSTVYVGSDKVQKTNTAYQARYWTQGNDPVTHSGQWDAWQILGQCDGGANNPPQVSIQSPLNNAKIPQGSFVGLQANASDSDGSITQVEFLVGTQRIAIDQQAPYQVDWTAALGATSVTAIATDNQGATTSSTVNISVTPTGNPVPPTVTLTSPTGSEQLTVGDVLAVAANATDSDGTVNAVEFYVDGQLVVTDSSEPYQFNWNAAVGSHTFKAKAIDNDNQSTLSQEVTLTVSSGSNAGCAGLPVYSAGTAYSAGQLVQNKNQKYRCDIAGWCSSSSGWAYEPGVGSYWKEAWSGLGACSTPPVVTLTNPTANQVILAGSTVSVAAQASDADGSVTQVEFFAGNNSLGVVTQAPYAVNWIATTTGNQTLKAVATDNDSNTSESAVSVTVSDQDLVVSLTSPTSGQTVGLGKPVNIAADATSLTNNVAKVEFVVNGAVVATDTTEPFAYSWTPSAIGNYTVAAKATDAAGTSVTSSAAAISVVEQAQKKHRLIGYWHNFVNGAGCPIRLADMSQAWDVIDIAFAENDRNSTGTVHFNLYAGDIYSSCPALDPAQFKQDMKALQAKGKVFVLSLGGAEGTITLNTDQDEANFVSSLTALIKEWGFDGLDVDLESGSNLVHGSQIQARLGRALKQIEKNIGGDMFLTMAPEHPYVQGGMVAYSGIWGAYIPVINEVRDTLDILHVQLYNNGGLPNPYTPSAAPEGSVDMMVAQSKMLIEGFTLANGTRFEPLRDDQVAIGLPSGPSSANSGQAPTQNILDALDCLTKGTRCGTIKPAFASPNYAGVMTWSINWDKHDDFNFSKPVGDKLSQMNNTQ
ncbi:chitinase [Vibrio cholerae]|uniref:Ig-like domain-containing protein n=1 Tax=Vibrio cholerae TaxID=666 RepID=UPI00019F2DC8|nr:Ig-like domain-containing protein [Vibrio cholerae]EEN98284.1 chitinase [Vibrio cholerae 12129(1)]KUO37071.1 chitinase [Vibrio cholerae]MDA5325285.1 chitinase [Vibrio cholerae]HDI3172542.1 chitinase [Vibrio cholerae]HDI3283912.1 chitinase [Vibrio cholerae]